MRWFVMIVALCWLAAPARAEPARGAALHFTRAPGAEACIAPRELARRVEQLTGPVLVSASTARLTLEVSAAPLGGLFRVRVHRVDERGTRVGTRTLTSKGGNCRELDAVLAFVLALAIDPQLSVADLPADMLARFAQEQAPGEQLLAELEGAPPMPVVPAPAPPVPVAVPVLPRQPEPERTHYVASARALLLAYGRSALFGPELSLTVDPPRVFPLLASARVGFGVTELDIPGGTGATLRAGELALQVCPLGVPWRSLRFRGCAGAAIGALGAAGLGFDVNRRARAFDASGLVTLSLWLRLSGTFGLVLEAGGRVRLVTTDFAVRDASGAATRVFQPALLGYSLALGPVYEF